MEAAGTRHILHHSVVDAFLLWNLADLHLHSTNCATKELARDIKRIADDPFSFWLGGGDFAEYIGYDDGKRFDPDCVSDKLTIADLGRLGKKSVEVVRDVFAPIKHKCLGLLLGNHEKLYQRKHQQEDLHAWLCAELEVPNLGYSCLFDVCFSRGGAKVPRLSDKPGAQATTTRKTYRIFAHHGAGYAQTPGGKLNRLIQFMRVFEADIYFIGHVHDKTGRREVLLGADVPCTHLTQKEKIGVISGSYLMTYRQGTTSYGEQRGYTPTVLGAAWVRIEPHKGRLAAEV